MATYHWINQGYAIPYDSFGHTVLRKKVDVPALIASGAAGYSPLAVSNVRTALASTGFASTDILNLFRVPAGFLILGGGCKVTTAGSSTTTIDVGCVAGSTQLATAGNDAGAFLETAVISATGNFNFDASTGTEWVESSDKLPVTNLYVTNGSIDLTFNTAAQLLLIADFWVFGVKVY